MICQSRRFQSLSNSDVGFYGIVETDNKGIMHASTEVNSSLNVSFHDAQHC